MNGFERTAAIRARETVGAYYRILIIALTAHSMKGDYEPCLEAGVDAYVTKPTRELFKDIESTFSATLR